MKPVEEQIIGCHGDGVIVNFMDTVFYFGK